MFHGFKHLCKKKKKNSNKKKNINTIYTDPKRSNKWRLELQNVDENFLLNETDDDSYIFYV